jgi:hypothetical protein
MKLVTVFVLLFAGLLCAQENTVRSHGSALVFVRNSSAGDASVQINAAIAALPASGGTVDASELSGAQTISETIFVGSMNKQVNLILGGATFTGSVDPLIMIDRASTLETHTSTIIQQNNSSGVAVVLSGDGPQWITGGVFGSATISGPGSNTASVGVYVGGGTNSQNLSTLSANQTELGALRIQGFGVGVQFGNQAWSFSFFHTFIGSNGTGILVPNTVVNFGESISAFGMNVSGNTNEALKIDAASSDWQIFGGSIDNNANGTPFPQVNLNSSGTSVNIHWESYGTHYEDTTTGPPDTKNNIFVQDGSVIIHGGFIVLCRGLIGSAIYGTGISKIVVSGVHFGGYHNTPQPVSGAIGMGGPAVEVFATGNKYEFSYINHILQDPNTTPGQFFTTDDGNGNVAVHTSGAVVAAGQTPAVAAGQIGLGSTTANTASAGTQGPPPGQVVGYIIVNIGGTNYKVPYYGN